MSHGDGGGEQKRTTCGYWVASVKEKNALMCIIMECAEIEKFQLLIGCVRKWRLNAYRPMMVIRARRRSNAPVSDINSRVVVVDSCILQTEMDWMVGETNQRSGHHHIYLYVTSLSITKREQMKWNFTDLPICTQRFHYLPFSVFQYFLKEVSKLSKTWPHLVAAFGNGLYVYFRPLRLYSNIAPDMWLEPPTTNP